MKEKLHSPIGTTHWKPQTPSFERKYYRIEGKQAYLWDNQGYAFRAISDIPDDLKVGEPSDYAFEKAHPNYIHTDLKIVRPFHLNTAEDMIKKVEKEGSISFNQASGNKFTFCNGKFLINFTISESTVIQGNLSIKEIINNPETYQNMSIYVRSAPSVYWINKK